MTTLANDEEQAIKQGVYAFDVTGALELQWRPLSTFKTLIDGNFPAAAEGTIELPATTLKVVNAGSDTITLLKVR